MQILSNARLKVVARNQRTGNDGKNYFNLAVLVEGQAGNISCTEEAYKGACPDMDNDVVLAFNDQYKSIRIMSAEPCNPKASTASK